MSKNSIEKRVKAEVNNFHELSLYFHFLSMFVLIFQRQIEMSSCCIFMRSFAYTFNFFLKYLAGITIEFSKNENEF